MRFLIAGACGFVGSALAESLLERREGISIVGLDNLMRPGSETNRARLRKMGVRFVHADIRCASDFESLPAVDWVVDAVANPSVLAGTKEGFSSRQLFEHNLAALMNVLEYAKAHRAGVVLLSSSRVYSIPTLSALPLKDCGSRFAFDESAPHPHGVSPEGVDRDFPITPPVSLYGAAKLASETMALEYGEAFDLPVWIDRCGVLAGAGQFGTADQGIFSFWIHSHRNRRPLRYIGFDGLGKQVRDALHPRDLAELLDAQIASGRAGGQRIYTAGGGPANSMSLAELNRWCDDRHGTYAVASDPRPRRYDVPWLVMDSRDAHRDFGWSVRTSLSRILEEIAVHAAKHPEWLEMSSP